VEHTPAVELMEGSPANLGEGTPADDAMEADEADTPSTDLVPQPSEVLAELQSSRDPAPAKESEGIAGTLDGQVRACCEQRKTPSVREGAGEGCARP
jgi:hypothetical protein